MFGGVSPIDSMRSIPVSSLTSYWNEFEVREEDLEFIYNLLLDKGIPLTTREMAEALVGRRLARLEKEREREAESGIRQYLPGDEYQVGEQVVFPALGSAVGTVTAVRPGQNPDLGPFDVIDVAFGDDGRHREFAARFSDHKMNRAPIPDPASEPPASVESVMSSQGRIVEDRLIQRLNQATDIVRIARRWFPRALLVDIHEGHLNLAEAVLDVANGGPLPTSAFMQHLGLGPSVDASLAEFSMDYALQEDNRFDEVGPAGEVVWYLRRLEPVEVLYPPPRLEYKPVPFDRALLTPPLLELERQLDDENSPLDETDEGIEEVTLAILFPHWRVGTLPLSSRLRAMFPTAYEAPRIRLILIDGHTGDNFPGWVVREQRFVYGMDEWYRRHQVPAGGLVRIKRGAKPGEVVVEAVDQRRRSEWIRTLTINAAGQIGFTMLKQAVGTAYDELMVVGVGDKVALDEAWLRGPQRRMTTEQLVSHVFRELAKLNPQSAVHAQALYSGVNTLRRLAPGPIFAELLTRSHYVHVGDLYWRLADVG